MKKIAVLMEKSILALLVVIYMGVLLINMCFQKVDYYRRKDFVLPVIGFVVVSILLCFMGYWIYKKYLKQAIENIKALDTKIKLASVVLFFIQVFICVNIYFMTGWDSGIITANADYVAKGEVSELWNWYYSRCPNNTLLTFIYMIIFWVAEHIGLPSTSVRLIIVFLQCIISSYTGYLLYQCMDGGSGKKGLALLSWGLYVVLIGLSPWMIIPYSDASCLFFPMLILRIYQTLERGHKILKCIAISFLAYIGYEMKAMVIIILIAIFIVEALNIMKSPKKTKKWTALGIMLVSLVGTMGVCNAVNLEKMMGFDINKESAFGLTHYFMMGLNYEHSGVFIVDDANYSQSIPTLEERKAENIRIAKERIRNFGPLGLTKHMVRKTMVNFNDGTFAWGQEGAFYGIKLSLPENPVTNLLRNYYYNNGAYHVVFETIVQCIWVLVLIGIVLNMCMLLGGKEINQTYLVTVLSVLGLTIFVMIFEARARYLYVYVPIYIFLAMKGYFSFLEYMKEKASEGKC